MPTTCPPVRPRRHAVLNRKVGGHRSGMSIIELLVGIVILTVGLLGLAGVSTVIMRQMNGSANQTIAATLAQSRFEQLEGRRCASIAGGTATTRGVTETWTATQVGIRGMRVADTVRFSGVRGSQTSIGLVTVVSCTQ